MLHREPVTLTLFDAADRTVTVEAVRTSLRLGVWKMGAFVDYTRPVRVIDRRGHERVEHRILDIGAMARLLIFIAGLIGLRGRADKSALGGLGLRPRGHTAMSHMA